MKKIGLSAFIALSVLGTSSNLSANDFAINYQVTGVSNYVLRGITQSDDKAAIFGDITLSYRNFFTGIWASNVSFEDIGVTDADKEIDYYIGYSNTLENFTYTAVYAKYTYPGSKMMDDLDELKFDLSYTIDKLTLGAKYEIGMWNESDSDKLDYIEAYTSYDLGLVNLNLSVGSFEDIGDNYKIGLSKTGTFEGKDIQFNLNYVNFDADNKGYPFKDDNKLFAEVIFSF